MKKPTPPPAPRCGTCGDRLDKKYIVNGWLIATHPIFCPVKFKG